MDYYYFFFIPLSRRERRRVPVPVYTVYTVTGIGAVPVGAASSIPHPQPNSPDPYHDHNRSRPVWTIRTGPRPDGCGYGSYVRVGTVLVGEEWVLPIRSGAVVGNGCGASSWSAVPL